MSAQPPPLLPVGRRRVWAGLAMLALAQALALVAGVAGTRMAFASLDTGAVPGLALGLVAGAALALSGLRPWVRLMAERLGQDHAIVIRKALFCHAMDAAPDRLAGRRRGYLMLRLTGDMTMLKDGIVRSLPPVVQAAALIPAGTLALLWIDPRLCAAGAALAGVSLVAFAGAGGSLRRTHKAQRSARARLVADMAERLPIAPDLARFGRRRAEVSRLARAGRALRRTSAARLIRAEVLRALPGGLAGLCAVAVLWDGARRGLSAGEIAAALAAIGVMGHALVELAGTVDRLSGWRVARQMLARHLADGGAPKPPSRPDAVRLDQAAGQFSVDAAPGLMFPPRLELAPGERGTIASADADRLLHLLTGQDTRSDVSVRLDGVAMDALSRGSIRRNIGVLSPSPVLLKGSTRRNICLGLSERPADATLLGRVRRAGLGPTLERLGGLDAPIPENGRTLGPSDRLRLSALRAAVRRPRVLLLATGGLPLPEDLQAHVDGCAATIVTVEPDRTGSTQAPGRSIP